MAKKKGGGAGGGGRKKSSGKSKGGKAGRKNKAGMEKGQKGSAGGNVKRKKQMREGSESKGTGRVKGKTLMSTASGTVISKADVGTKRKADADTAPDTDKKGKATLTAKKQKRKEVTTLYNELINPGRTRKADVCVNEILEILGKRSGTLAEYCSKQIGARVVQACLKWGTRQHRRQLLTGFKEHLPKMALDRYGHQVVLKILLYASKTSTDRKPTDEEKKAQAQNIREILDRFTGKNLHATFYHRHGCKVINGIYFSEAVGTKEKRRMLHDIAIPQAVALLRPELPGSQPLRQLLRSSELTEKQRKEVQQHLLEAAERAIEKELLGYDIVHLLFQALCDVASETQLTELAEKCMGGAPYLLSSKPGAEAILRLLGVANAKQRKALCKDLKGKFADLAKNAVDYVVMIRLATTVDDTVLVVKSMITEFIQDIDELCFDKYGHKVLSWLFRPDDKHLFSPYERECVALPAPTSLKAPETRQLELVRAIKPSIRKVFLARPLEAAADLHAKDLLAAYLASDWDVELLEALLVEAEQAAQTDDFGLLDNGTVTTTLIVLLKLQPDKGRKPDLASELWQRCLEPQLVTASSTRCAFVLLALLKGGDASLRESVLAAVRSKRAKIEKAATAAEARGAKAGGARKLLAEAGEAA